MPNLLLLYTSLVKTIHLKEVSDYALKKTYYKTYIQKKNTKHTQKMQSSKHQIVNNRSVV